MSSVHFYTQLPRFASFDEVANKKHYHALPDDWVVVIADIKGSTKAIEDNRYKDVNTVGAASIVCVYNVLNTLDFPFVFGGDGATILLHKTQWEKARDALSSLITLSKEQFDLELRVGMVPVPEIIAAGHAVNLARYELFPKHSIAFVRGGGLAYAEERIKQEPELFNLKPAGGGLVELKGLSCRWQSIPNSRGSVLSLLVLSQKQGDEANEIYHDVVERMRDVFGGNMDAANPMNLEQMRYKSVNACVRDEARYHTQRRSLPWVSRLLEIIAAVAVFKHGLHPLAFSPKRYKQSLKTHSDFRKFDDMLRMVLDCAPEEIANIRSFLNQLHEEGLIYYGMYESESSLMTCFVDNVHDKGHVHFIDGNHGGYALAAKELKAQMKC